MTALDTRLRATFTRVVASEEIPPLPDFRSALDGLDAEASPLGELFGAVGITDLGVTRRRRRALLGIGAVAILGGGLSVAGAAGLPVLPGAVMQELGWTPAPAAYNADPATARQLLTVPGPDGELLRLWYADANDNGYCVTLSAAVDGDPDELGGLTVDPGEQPRDGVGGGGCSGPIGDRWWTEFGGDAVVSSNASSTTFIVHVPGAARVDLVLDDGTAQPLPVGDSWTAGWLTEHDADEQPTLVGVAADGSQVGRYPIPVHESH